MIENIINPQIIFDNTNRDFAIIIFAICILLIAGNIIHEKYCIKNNS